MRWMLIITVWLMVGCGPIDQQYYQSDEEPVMASIFLQLTKDSLVNALGDLVLNLTCDNVYSPSATADWSRNNVSATTSINVVANKSCSITVVSYSDGINNYTAVGSRLVINIASNGTISNSTPQQYTSGGGAPLLQWFSAKQNVATYAAVINYAASLVTSTNVTQNNLLASSFSTSMAAVLSPAVSAVTLTITNNAGSYSYTLTASVSGAVGCKYIDNSSGTYNAASWASVHTAYRHAQAVACPVLTPGSAPSGNWASLWVLGKITLVMWANTVNGVNAYTTVNFGP